LVIKLEGKRPGGSKRTSVWGDNVEADIKSEGAEWIELFKD